jgi:6-pyruvoyltetrahydropterin/6-carboxytetrahydropterin synthase
MHGHSFRVDVIVAGEIPAGEHHLVDYGLIAQAVEPVRKKLDHYCLNDIPGLENPTSESLAAWIWERLEAELPLLSEIHVHETCTTRCEFRRADQQGR